MLIALMTDLHANREALSTCLAHAEEQKVTHYAFLGDIVGYGADPGWVLQTVMDYVAKGNWALMGNHDVAILQDMLLVHANAWAPDKWEYIDGVMEAMRSMHACKAAITFCGHVHMPTLYHMTLTGKTGEFLPTPENSIPLSKQRRWLVIPGSLGQPRDGNPAACYATFDTETQELTYFRVPYDHESAAKKILAAGLPAALANRLLTGE